MVRLLGFLFLGLALLGVFLPLLPTTPFVLVAAACFAQSSERMHRWILTNRTFGPMVRDWEEKRCVSCRWRPSWAIRTSATSPIIAC